jgi:hypothetical protein
LRLIDLTLSHFTDQLVHASRMQVEATEDLTQPVASTSKATVQVKEEVQDEANIRVRSSLSRLL